jgi:tetratricopeptide (TPR) repeat protein
VAEKTEQKTESKPAALTEKREGEASSVSFLQKAEALLGEGRYEEAIGTCREGLERNPEVLAGRVLLGRCYLEKGMMDQARKELEKVAQEIEACLPVYRFLSQIYLQAKEVDKALEVMRKTMYFTAPAEPEVKKTTPLEMGLLHRGKYPPFSVPPLAEQERRVKKEVTEEQGKENKEAVPFQTDTLAEIYIKQGRLDKALAVYRDILKREPENANVRAKFEALQRKPETDRGVPGKKIQNQLERWLAVVSTQTHSDSGA